MARMLSDHPAASKSLWASSENADRPPATKSPPRPGRVGSSHCAASADHTSWLKAEPACFLGGAGSPFRRQSCDRSRIVLKR